MPNRILRSKQTPLKVGDRVKVIRDGVLEPAALGNVIGIGARGVNLHLDTGEYIFVPQELVHLDIVKI